MIDGETAPIIELRLCYPTCMQEIKAESAEQEEFTLPEGWIEEEKVK